MRIPSFLLPLLLLASSHAPLRAQESVEDLVKQAQSAAKGKEFATAAALMNKAIQLAPNNDFLLALASDYELKSGKFADGLEHALAAVKLNDQAGDYYVLVAGNAFGNQDLEKCREYCEIVLKREKEFQATPVNDAKYFLSLLSKRTFTVHFELDPQRGRIQNGVLPIAMAKDGLPYQSATYEISGVRSQRLVKGDINDMLLVVPQGTKTIELTMKITVQAYSYKKALANAADKPLPKEAQAFLGPIVTVDPRSPVLRKIALELKGKTPLATVHNIQKWMNQHIEYKLENKNNLKLDFRSVDEIIHRGKAECRGYSLLFTGLCRAAGIPARPIWGMFRLGPSADRQISEIVSHNWAEVYIAGAGWIPLDPQRPETLGFLPTNFLRVFMDSQRTESSTEALPMINLLNMEISRLRFEEALEK